MIIYDSKNWGDLFLAIKTTFKHSYSLLNLLKAILIILFYSTIVCVLELEVLKRPIAIETFYFSLIGVILSLFLVFRLNSSYDRWWEGRKQWGKLVNDSRTFALSLNSLIPLSDRKRRKFYVVNIANFATALQWHLRLTPSVDKLIYLNRSYIEELEQVRHVPNQIASYMFDETERLYKEGAIVEADKINLKVQLQGFVDVLGACERIQKTPIPFSHSSFIKTFILIYLLILPFGLVEQFQYLTIPAVLVMGFALVGIELISEEIENPFGLDANDLPTGQIADTIRENVYEILHIRSNFRGTQHKKGVAEMVH
jgi:putative membrane protein